MKVELSPSAPLSYAALFGALLLYLRQRLHTPLPSALLLATAALAVHLASIAVHHLGHAAAARSTGWPMRGVRLWAVLASSLYPPDEPPLPPSLHLRRALGGPAASLLLTAMLGYARAGVMAPPQGTPFGRGVPGGRSAPWWQPAAQLRGLRPLRTPGVRPRGLLSLQAASGRSNPRQAVSFLLTFALLDNLALFSFGSLLPLGFTDGSTILRYAPPLRPPPRDTGPAPSSPAHR